jgi:hypothetical protein
MTPKIRKLYNVLVVGGMLAAGTAGCSKKAASPAKPGEPAKTEPASGEAGKTDAKNEGDEGGGVKGWS